MKNTMVKLPFSQIASCKFFPPNIPIVSPNNKLHGLESKSLKNNESEGQLHSTCLKHFCINLYKVVHFNGFNVSNQGVTYVVGIFMFLHYVEGT
jgi:hypothetical protein